jgi:hypothetical protein
VKMMGEVIPFPDLPSEQDDALMELSSGVGVGVFVHEDEDGSVGHSAGVFECCSGLVDLVVCIHRHGSGVIASPLRARDS